MPPKAPAKPKAGAGGFMKAKVGPVPLPLLVAGVAGVVVFLYFRHKSSTAPTSAGSTSTPDTNMQPYPSGDSTGGGAGGLDLSSLLDALAGLSAQLGYTSSLVPVGGGVGAAGQTGTAPALAQAAPISPGAVGAAGLSTGAASGGDGNTAPPVTASQPSAPLSSFDTSTLDVGGYNVETIQSGPAEGSQIFTPTPSTAATVNASPNILRTVGSDASQISTQLSAPHSIASPPKITAPVAGYGGGKTAGQVRRNA